MRRLRKSLLVRWGTGPVVIPSEAHLTPRFARIQGSRPPAPAHTQLWKHRIGSQSGETLRAIAHSDFMSPGSPHETMGFPKRKGAAGQDPWLAAPKWSLLVVYLASLDLSFLIYKMGTEPPLS